MLNDMEKKVVAAIQGDIPVSQRPYKDIAERIGSDEKTVLFVLRNLQQKGLIRRFGATLRHQKSGFTANAMVAWKVDESMADQVGEKMAKSPAVSHCYRRNSHKHWPYNLYTMIHATDRQECRKLAKQLSLQTGINEYTLLFSTRELKKTSMVYFEDELDTEE
jgi:DNA-binding Lrp family transcriptional regulator